MVIVALDRAFRNLREMLEVADLLLARGIGFVSIMETFDSSTPEGRFQMSVMGAMAELERKRIGARIKMGLKEKAEQGHLVGPLPIGYIREQPTEEVLPSGRRRIVPGDVVMDPVAGPLVREAFRLYEQGQHSLSDLAKWADSVGLRTREGRLHDKDSIRTMLTNIAYTGQVAAYRRKGGAIIANGKHPALIDAATFAQVQSVLEQRRYAVPATPFSREPYPLSGTAVCAFCAAPLVGSGSKRGAHRYMRCATTLRHGRDACRQPMVSALELEGQVAEYVAGMKLPAHYLGAVVAELRRMTSPEPRRRQTKSPSCAARWTGSSSSICGMTSGKKSTGARWPPTAAASRNWNDPCRCWTRSGRWGCCGTSAACGPKGHGKNSGPTSSRCLPG